MNVYSRQKILGFTISILITVSSAGQSFIHLTSNDGLPDNHARFIYQDSSLYIYIGTRNGLSRYDGYNFSGASVCDTLSLAPREFSAMIESEEGYFTVASSGIFRYDKKHNSLKLSRELNLLDEACFTRFGDKLYCGNSAGLFVFEPRSGHWVNCNHYLSGMEGVHVRKMMATPRGELLLGTSKGFFRFGEDMSLLETDIGNNSFYHNITGIVQDRNGGYWFSTFNNLYFRNADFQKGKEYREQFADKHIRCLETDADHRIWIGGEFGIIIIDPESKKTTELFRDISNSRGLNDNAVYSIFRDQSDNIWVGTYFGGINLWSGSFDNFSSYLPGPAGYHLSGKVVREMQEDRSGNLWLALEDGGLNYLNLKTGRVKRFFFATENEYRNVHSVILKHDTLWVGSFNNGLECYKITFMDSDPFLTRIYSCLEDEMIFAISPSRDNKIYAGSAGAIYIIDIQKRKVETCNEEIFRNRIIYTLKVISNSKLLVGTLRNGLYHCDLDHNITTSYLKDEDNRLMQSISSINRLDSISYTVTSSSGLHIFNVGTGTLKCLLHSEEPYEFRAVAIDQEGDFWISSTNGLFYFDPRRDLVRKYTRYNGLPENQFNFNSAFRTLDNRLFFGSYQGLITFDPVKLKRLEERVPNVSFTGYTVVGEDRKTLESFYFDNNSGILRLRPYQTFLSLEFSALGFTRVRDLNYQMRILGQSKNWDDLNSNRSVTLTKLSKGWHKVEIRPVSEGSVFGPPTMLRIYRQPAWWQTIYAILIYLFLLTALLLVIRKVFIGRQKEKNALALERLEKEQQKKLNEQKMRFFLDISHEFRTPLTIIGGTISNILRKFNPREELRTKLETIRNTSDDLNQLVNDFIDYEKSVSGLKPIQLERKPILPFVEKASSMFDNWAEINDLVYTKNIQQSNETGYFDPQKLERIIYNLLSNAFKYNNRNGSVVIESNLRKEGETRLEFRVKDTGPGVPDKICNDLKKYLEGKDESIAGQEGIGLVYTARLIHQMSGKMQIESEPGKGTGIVVEIPVVLPENEPASQETEFESRAISIPGSTEERNVRSMIKEEKKPLILVIDDNRDLLHMLEESLEPEYRTFTLTSPLQALSIATQQDFSLVICDIMMPEMNGFEVIESFQSNILLSHIPILILTAAADKSVELNSYKKGAVSYLSKPFKIDELKIKVESILSLRRELIRRFQSSKDFHYGEITCSAKDEQFLQKAVSVVHEHLNNPEFDVEQFCERMNVSRTLLHTKLKSITGQSATEFIRKIRLDKAYIYLKKGSMPVSEVAYLCGFNDPNYFSRCFRKAFNVFPSKVRDGS
ncbi:MAG: response regulator [Bacteroidales bacterium]|nr:response regulator [Bacteroidales bacterium]MBN2698903.1 response regulator [Bacteroidales bacterium]